MCPDCEARRQLVRQAWLKAQLGEVVAQVATGAAEVVGLKPKTAEAEMRGKSARRAAPEDPPPNDAA